MRLFPKMKEDAVRAIKKPDDFMGGDIPDFAAISAAAAKRSNGAEAGCPWISEGLLIYIPVAGSTNSYAKELAAKGRAEGTVVIAGGQTEGRGRLGRKWDSAIGKGVYLSVILRPRIQPSEIGALTLAAAVAVVEAVNELLGSGYAGVKWPNDVLVKKPADTKTRKICGILAEMMCGEGGIEHLVLGIGINVNHVECDFPAELREKAVSLRMAYERINGVDRIFCRAAVTAALLSWLEKGYNRYIAGDRAGVMDDWRRYSLTIGREVLFEANGVRMSGMAKDIDINGKLVVSLEGGEEKILNSGEIILKGKAGFI